MDQKNQGHSSGQRQNESDQRQNRQSGQQMSGNDVGGRHAGDRDPAEGSRDTVRDDQARNDQATPRDRHRSDSGFSGSQGGTERGKGSQGERNRAGGISNRGMDRESEQQDLPSRGSNRSSER